MKYTAVKVLELELQRLLLETLGNSEAGIVILAGKVTVSVGDVRFEGIGVRQCVFDKISTDSVYVGTDLSFKLLAQTLAKVLMLYRSTTTLFSVWLIKGDIYVIEHRGRYVNKRLV